MIIDIEDARTGLTSDEVGEVIGKFDKRESVRTGLGAVLESARKAVEANHGTLSARAVPGKGCLYLIDLPQVQ